MGTANLHQVGLLMKTNNDFGWKSRVL